MVEAGQQEQIENYDLWQRYQQDGDEDIRDELVIENLSLVKHQARRLEAVLPDFISREDLESYGLIGLMQAIDRFDSERGVEFSTFARRRIRGAMIDHLRQLDWLPHSLRRDASELVETRRQLKGELERAPEMDELLQEVSFSRERIKKLDRYLNSSQWLSLDTEYEDARMYDFIPARHEGPLKSLEKAEKKEVLAEAVENLKEQEQLVISLYYHEGLNQKEIAEVMELSSSRISQLHRKAIQRLRGYISRKG